MRLQKNSHGYYQNLSKEEKGKKREYFKNRTLNMSGEQNEIVSCILEIDVINRC